MSECRVWLLGGSMGHSCDIAFITRPRSSLAMTTGALFGLKRSTREPQTGPQQKEKKGLVRVLDKAP